MTREHLEVLLFVLMSFLLFRTFSLPGSTHGALRSHIRACGNGWADPGSDRIHRGRVSL